VSLTDVGIASIVFKYSFASVKQLPVKAISADRIVETSIIAFHHVSKEIADGFVIGPKATGM
jgi:hypothetical protein